MEKRNNFAVLIDADNVSPERFERIFGELSLWGNATYRRIYGNWADYNRSALKEKLVEYALTPVQQFNYIKGKKAEWDDYRTKVSQWEIDKYMINY